MRVDDGGALDAGSDDSRRRQAPPRLVVPALVAILLLGAALRLYHLDRQSLWWDEAISVTIAGASLDELPSYRSSNPPAPRFGWNAATERVGDVNPPIYFVALHAWLGAFGRDAWQVRSLSVAAGVLALFVLFKVGEALFDAHTALLATLLLAVSQLGVLYSQEARNYELLLLLFLVTVFCYVLAMTRRSLLFWTCFTVSAVLMVGTHYYGVLALVGLGLHMALHWRRASVPLVWIAASLVFALVTFGPWILPGLGDRIAAATPGREYRWSVVHWTTPISTLNRFNNGTVHSIIETMPRWTFFVGGVLFTLPVVIMAVRPLRGSKAGATSGEAYATSLCLLTGVLPPVIVLLLGAVASIKYDVRYVAFCIAPYYLLVAAGISRLSWTPLKAAFIAAIVGYSGYALRANYWSPYKEDFRGAAAYVQERAAEGDCYAFPPFSAPPLGWMIYMPGPPGARVLTPQDDEASLARCPRSWVVTYERGQEEASPSAWDGWLAALRSAHQRADDRQFYWIRVELFNGARPQRQGG